MYICTNWSAFRSWTVVSRVIPSIFSSVESALEWIHHVGVDHVFVCVVDHAGKLASELHILIFNLQIIHLCIQRRRFLTAQIWEISQLRIARILEVACIGVVTGLAE